MVHGFLIIGEFFLFFLFNIYLSIYVYIYKLDFMEVNEVL